ncbi:MAG: hypothetical protein ACFFCS_25915 [Candidatus Hodarchaeota archaeon]
MKEIKDDARKKHSSLWDGELVEKQRYFSMIRPLVNMEDLKLGKPELTYLTQHYDPLAIALRIVSLVIENTKIIMLQKVSGMTRTEILNKLKPLFDTIDKDKNLMVSDEHRKKFVNRIIDKLIASERHSHLLSFTDYRLSPFEKQVMPFQLLYLDQNLEGEYEVMVNYRLINIFTRILDMKIEHEHLATMFVLDHQIKQGDLENALISANRNYNLTLVKVAEVVEIIQQTKRKFHGSDWFENYPATLKDALQHIQTCILQNKRQQEQLIQRKDSLLAGGKTAYEYLVKIGNAIEKSMDLLLPLQGKVREARTTFLKEQMIHAFKRRFFTAVSLEEDLLEDVLNLRKGDVNSYLPEFLYYFSNCSKPRISNLSNNLDLMMRSARIKKAVLKMRKRRDLKKASSFISENVPFSTDLKRKVMDALINILNVDRESLITLDQILRVLESQGMTTRELNFARMFIQGRFASDAFEGRLMNMPTEVELDGEFSVFGFKGANYKIKLTQHIQ